MPLGSVTAVTVLIDTEAEPYCGPVFDDLPIAVAQPATPPPTPPASPALSQVDANNESASPLFDSPVPPVANSCNVVRGVENVIARSIRVVVKITPKLRKQPSRTVGRKASLADISPVPVPTAEATPTERTVVTFVLLPIDLARKVDKCGNVTEMVQSLADAEANESEMALGDVRLHFLLMNFGNSSRDFGGPRSVPEATLGATFALASTAVCGVTFVGTHRDIFEPVRLATLFAFRKAGTAEKHDASAMTEPMNKGPKVDIDWAKGYLRMLSEIPTMTEPRARCIASVFPTMHSLMEGLREQPALAPTLRPVTEAHLSPKFQALARTVEPDTTSRGADRTAKRFGANRVATLIRALRTPYDAALLDQGADEV
jgi:hypothetical protein